jgi:hypothetical protein
MPGATVLENVTEGLITELGIQRHDHAPSRNHRQASRDPLLGISGEERHVIPTVYPSPTQATRKTQHPVGELAVRPDLHALLTKRHQRWPLTTRREPIDYRRSQRAPPIRNPPLRLTPISHQPFLLRRKFTP